MKEFTNLSPKLYSHLKGYDKEKKMGNQTPYLV